METLLVGTSYCYCGHPAAAERGEAACPLYKLSASLWWRSSERLTFKGRKKFTSRERNGHQSQILFGTLQLLRHNLQDLLGCTRNFCLHTDVGVLRYIHVAKNCTRQKNRSQPENCDHEGQTLIKGSTFLVLRVKCEQLDAFTMSMWESSLPAYACKTRRPVTMQEQLTGFPYCKGSFGHTITCSARRHWRPCSTDCSFEPLLWELLRTPKAVY